MLRFLVLAGLAGAIACTTPLAAQYDGPVRPEPAFASWSPAVGPPAHVVPMPGTPVAADDGSLRRGLIGGVVGAAAGLLACTIISNIADDSADPGSRISTCTASGYLLFGGVGFGVGFLIGSATR